MDNTYFVNECLGALEPAGFNAAIDGHWQAMDSDGTLDRSKLPQPDLKALAAAGAAQPYQITAQMRDRKRIARLEWRLRPLPGPPDVPMFLRRQAQ